MAGLPDAVQRAIQMGKLMELHASAPGALDHPLLQVVGGVGVVVQDVSKEGDVLKQLEKLSYLDLSSTV